MYAFQVYLQILVPKQFYLTQENSQQLWCNFWPKCPNFSQPGQQKNKKTTKKKKMVSLQKWLANDAMIKKQDHNDPTHTVGRTKNTST